MFVNKNNSIYFRIQFYYSFLIVPIQHNQQNQVEKKFLAQLNTLKDLIEEKNKEILNLKEQMSNQSAHYEEEISRLRQEYSINEEFCKDKKKVNLNIHIFLKIFLFWRIY